MRLNTTLFVLLLWPLTVFGQGSASAPASDSSSAADTTTTVLEHPASGRFWISGQINVIGQGHPSFRAKYSGPNSLKSKAELAVSNLLTLYTGFEVNKTTEVIFDVESAGGHGISDALGLGGFTNLDVVRSPDLGQAPCGAAYSVLSTFSMLRILASTATGVRCSCRACACTSISSAVPT